VLHGVLEQYKVHNGINIIVLTESEVKLFGQSVSVGELIVELLVKTLDEVGEDKRLRSGTEVFLQVEFGEGLGGNIGSDLTIFG
jgi:hypothetical protein